MWLPITSWRSRSPHGNSLESSSNASRGCVTRWWGYDVSCRSSSLPSRLFSSTTIFVILLPLHTVPNPPQLAADGTRTATFLLQPTLRTSPSSVTEWSLSCVLHYSTASFFLQVCLYCFSLTPMAHSTTRTRKENPPTRGNPRHKNDSRHKLIVGLFETQIGTAKMILQLAFVSLKVRG
jgi:hypothetical protein